MPLLSAAQSLSLAGIHSFVHPQLAFVSPEAVTLAAATGGFDAVMQLRSDLLAQQLASSFTYGYLLRSSYVYDSSLLPSTVKAAVSSAAAQLTASAANPGLGDFSPRWFLLEARNPKLQFSVDPDTEIRVTLDIVVSVQFAQGQDFRQPWEFDEGVKVICVGRVAVSPDIDVTTDAAAYELRAWADFTTGTPSLSTSDPLFQDLMDQGFLPGMSVAKAVDSLIAPLMTGKLAITPTMCLAGKRQAGETLVGVTAFSVRYVIRPHGSWHVLCLGIDTTATDPGSLGQLAVMLGSSSFSYYFSTKIAAAVVLSRWKRPAITNKLVLQTKVPMKDDDGDTAYGKATLEWQWTTLVNAYIPPAAWSTGAVRIKAWANVVVKKLWNYEGDQVSPGDQPELFQPFKKAYTMDYCMFEQPAPPADPTDQVAQQGLVLVEPLYRPTTKTLDLKNISGLLSTGLGGGLVRGDLEVEL